jgi:hypothetical protein
VSLDWAVFSRGVLVVASVDDGSSVDGVESYALVSASRIASLMVFLIGWHVYYWMTR